MSDLTDLNFNANDVQPNNGFDPIPKGTYPAVAVNSEVKTTNKGDGKYLKIEFQILSGDFQNRKLWSNFNLWNPSAEAVQIARGQFSALCRAVNVLTPKDSSELHMKPMRIKVSAKPRKDDPTTIENRIDGFEPSQAGPVQPVQPVQTQTTNPAASPAGAPW